MRRALEKDLLEWKSRSTRLPLLLRGARQVGKTYLVEQFAREHFPQAVTINFELQPELASCFDSLEPAEILNSLTLLHRQKITPGDTLLFLDEIQECPNAIRALRYFKEKLPELHVIAAGSLLEFTLNDPGFRMPVGRVESLYLYPLSFKEFLLAMGYQDLHDYLEQVAFKTIIPDAVHQHLLKLVREYMVLGGMPAVLQAYLTSQNMHDCQLLQAALLNTYRNDFGKYAGRTNHKYLQRLFEKAPGLVAEHFKYAKVDPDMRSRDIKTAFEALRYAGLIYPVYATTAAGLPLISLVNEKKFKLLFLDIGLLNKTRGAAAELLLDKENILMHQGALAEQFVGQELIAYASAYEEANLYFWHREKRSSQAEVDYITTYGASIVPIEVKAGTTGRLKSLNLFMQERNIVRGVRISQSPLQLEKNILSLPLYMMGELKRLVTEEG
jgi:hypothetical protein